MAHILSSVSGADTDLVPVQRALLSVSDKTGLIELATYLHSIGVELLSTGGTAKAIRNEGYCSPWIIISGINYATNRYPSY